MAAKKPRPLMSPFALPLAVGAVVYFVLLRPSAAGGKEWRGYQGTVILKPSVVYRIEMRAPLSNNPSIDFSLPAQQAAFEATLEKGGARNFLWNVVPDGVHVYFDQSYQTPTSLHFGTSQVGPLVALTAHRVDGLDWNAP